MSWLDTRKIQPSDYNPDEKVEFLIREKGELAARILDAFNQTDPLRCFYGDNIDEYVGYVHRFLRQVEGKDFYNLSDEEIDVMIRKSFHEGQIGKFAEEGDVARLIETIKALRKPVK